jgi:hypothetical protein
VVLSRISSSLSQDAGGVLAEARSAMEEVRWWQLTADSRQVLPATSSPVKAEHAHAHGPPPLVVLCHSTRQQRRVAGLLLLQPL